MSFQRILVALDHSQLSESVFAHALELTQAYQATLKLFHCLTVDPMGEAAIPSVPGEIGQYPGLADNIYWRQQIGLQGSAEQAEALLQNHSNIATSQGVVTEFEHRVGEPGRQLCQAAKDWGADLIVLGRRGHKGLAEVFVGSVSNHVVHHAPCSVLVIQTG